MIEIINNKIVIRMLTSQLQSLHGLVADEDGLLMSDLPVRFVEMEEAKNANQDLEEFVKSYRAIFPDEYKGNRKKCIENMGKFFKEFPNYNRELILAVTKFYIQECISKKRFIREAQYFIYKREVGSPLEGYCERFYNTGLDLSELEGNGGRYS